MNQWSTERRIIYLSVILSVIFVIVVIPVVYFFRQAPTCFDGKQNGTEGGVDCGGTCQLLCSFDTIDPLILWSRVFNVAGGVHSAISYIQNPNLNSEALVKYVFKLYDAQNVLIGQKENTTIIPKNKTLAIFEPNIDTQLRTPSRVTFEIVDKPVWRKNLSSPIEISVTQKVLSGESTRPRVNAIIENKSFDPAERIEAVAIVYNDRGNAIAASRTFVDRLEKDRPAQITFTWPQAFPIAQEFCPGTVSTVSSTDFNAVSSTALSSSTTSTTTISTATDSSTDLTETLCSSGPSVVEIITRVIPATW